MADAAALYYGVCSTSSNLPIKDVTCPDFVLETGAKILVLMSEMTVVGNISVRVNGTNSKPLVTKLGSSVNSINTWAAGDYVFLTYNGAQWVWVNSNETVSTQTDSFTTSTTTDKAVSQSSGNYPFKLGFFSKQWEKGAYGEKWINIKASDLGLAKIFGAVACPIRSNLSNYTVGLAVKITSTFDNNSVYIGLDENDGNCEGLFAIAWGI